MSSPVSRRDFVADSAKALAAFTIVPRHVLGGPGFRAPSDTLDVACVGVGGMGGQDVNGIATAAENIVALCDVDDRQAANTFARFPKAKKYRDYRELFEKDGRTIDAVTVSTPDHTHAVIALAAMKMGKHVYVQKPLARTISEVRALMDGARRYKVQTQMGNQGHAGNGTRALRELIEAGAIGTVREIQIWTTRPIWPQAIDRPTEMHSPPPTLDWNLWLGPAPERPYHPAYVPFRWRGWWDFGTGALGDIAPHAMDAGYWILGLGFPSRIEAETTRLYPETAPRVSRIIYDFPARGARGPVRVLWRDGELAAPRPEGLPPEVVWPGYNDVGTQVWIGSEGSLLADAYGDRPIILDEAKQRQFTASPPPQKYPRVPNVYAEWIAACKGGPAAGSNFVDHAGPLTQMVLLGNLAVRAGKAIDVDPATGQVKTSGIPTHYVTAEYRKGWSL